MQYALVNGIRTEPEKGLKGTCTGCGGATVAKCGVLKLHHWAHAISCKCDSWWETETEWHRNWKEKFPESYREISFYDPVGVEYHRADVHTPSGLTLEFQNSPLSSGELQSREAFYSKLIWVVNALKFKGFEITFNIPSPNYALLADYDFRKGRGISLTRKSEAGNRMVEYLSLHHGELRHIKESPGHFAFEWKHAHLAWYASNSPVFLDFGGEALFWLRKRVQHSENYWYLQVVQKDAFLLKYQ